MLDDMFYDRLEASETFTARLNQAGIIVVGDEDVPRIARENDGAVLHVCMRVADMTQQVWPELAARRRQILCEGCREPIWFDPLSIPEGLIAISKCVQCFTGAPGPFGFPGA